MEAPRCQAVGCDKPAGKRGVYCTEHVHRLRPCGFEGCETMIAAYNRSGFCGAHKWFSQKLKRASRALLLALLLPAVSRADPAGPCQTQTDGRVCCDGPSFKTLTDKCLAFRQERDLCRIDLGVVIAERDRLSSILSGQSSATAPTVNTGASVRPLAAYVLGTAGAALTTLPWMVPNADGTWRLGLSVAGVVGLAGGLLAAVWVQ